MTLTVTAVDRCRPLPPDHPRPGGSRRGRRRALATAGMVATLTMATLGAAGCSATTGPAGSAATTLPPATTASTAPDAPAALAAASPWFLRGTTVGAGQALPVEGPDKPRAALDLLFNGRSPADVAAGLTDAIDPNTDILGYRVEGDVAVVDLSRTFETANTRPQVAQVVYTLTQFKEIKKVRFLIEGEPNGATGVPAIGRDDLGDITPAVLLESPTPGAAPVRTFRANGTTVPTVDQVAWRVEVGGAVVASGTTPANTAKGAARKRFSAAVDLGGATAGPADLIVGSGPDEISLPIVIGP
ncbi:MAG: GerMN domain-containing protein [Acidimicrobiales bacterium]